MLCPPPNHKVSSTHAARVPVTTALLLQRLKREKGLKTDAKFANFLLERLRFS